MTARRSNPVWRSRRTTRCLHWNGRLLGTRNKNARPRGFGNTSKRASSVEQVRSLLLGLHYAIYNYTTSYWSCVALRHKY